MILGLFYIYYGHSLLGLIIMLLQTTLVILFYLMIDNKNYISKKNFIRIGYRNIIFVAISILCITQVFFVIPRKELNICDSETSMKETSYRTSLILRSLFFD